MAKLVAFDKDVRDRILMGSSKLTKLVGKTMGPKGKHVMIGKSVGAPVITKDGVSVARQVVLDDPFEDLACQLIKEVSARQADTAGDGTTTATVLTDAILRQGYALLEDDVNSIDLKAGFELALELSRDFITKSSKVISSYDQILNIASISCNNDPELGKLIADAYQYAGLEGVVVAEANGTTNSYVKFIDGLEVKSGFKDARFVDNGNRSVILNDPYILCINKEITHLDEFKPLLTRLHKENASFVLLAKDVSKSALELLVGNNKLGKLRCCAVKLPKELTDGDKFENMCLLLGANSNVADLDEDKISESDCGRAKLVEASSAGTMFTDTAGNKEYIDFKIKSYKEMLEDVMGDRTRFDIDQKIKFLNSKAAIISVGYSTELELREKGDRIEDAIWATRYALEDGIVPGGGTTLLRCAEMLKSVNHEKYQRILNAFAEVCTTPFKTICSNSGANPEGLMAVVLNKEEFSFGYDARDNVTGDLYERGVVDPVKVTLVALTNSVSICLVLLNTEAILAENPQKKSDWQPWGGWRPPEDNALNHNY